MGDRIKEISQYKNGIWQGQVPIGADAENIDIETVEGDTISLQTALGQIDRSTSISEKIGEKVNQEHGDIKDTLITDNINSFDTDSAETSEKLISTGPDDEEGNRVVVTAGESEVLSTMWTKFNRFRKRVDNKFKNYLKTSIGTGAGYDNNHAYSAAAINTYLSNVIGYTSATTPGAGKVSAQLSSLNSQIANWDYYCWKGGNLKFPIAQNVGASIKPDIVLKKSDTSQTVLSYDGETQTSTCLKLYTTGGVWNNSGYKIRILVTYHITFANNGSAVSGVTSRQAQVRLITSPKNPESWARGTYLGTYTQAGNAAPLAASGAAMTTILPTQKFGVAGNVGASVSYSLKTSTSARINYCPIAYYGAT